MARRDFPLPLMGLVHTSIEITSRTAADARRPARTRWSHAEELRPHRRGTEVVVVTEARVGGELVWADRSTYLARHPVRGAAADGTGGPGAVRRGRRRPRRDEPLPVVERWQLPAGLGRRHARVSGDYNPIHLSALTARPLGFPRAIAHGMWTVARCGAALPGHRRPARFRAPVTLPSRGRLRRVTAPASSSALPRGSTSPARQLFIAGGAPGVGGGEPPRRPRSPTVTHPTKWAFPSARRPPARLSAEFPAPRRVTVVTNGPSHDAPTAHPGRPPDRRGNYRPPRTTGRRPAERAVPRAPGGRHRHQRTQPTPDPPVTHPTEGATTVRPGPPADGRRARTSPRPRGGDRVNQHPATAHPPRTHPTEGATPVRPGPPGRRLAERAVPRAPGG